MQWLMACALWRPAIRWGVQLFWILSAGGAVQGAVQRREDHGEGEAAHHFCRWHCHRDHISPLLLARWATACNTFCMQVFHTHDEPGNNKIVGWLGCRHPVLQQAAGGHHGYRPFCGHEAPLVLRRPIWTRCWRAGHPAAAAGCPVWNHLPVQIHTS